MFDRNRYRFLIMIIALIISSFALSACGKIESATPNKYTLVSKDKISEIAELASPDVQEAYLFAISNPDILIQFPCYCGCGSMGHMSNLDCYIEEVNPDGSIAFDYHALG